MASPNGTWILPMNVIPRVAHYRYTADTVALIQRKVAIYSSSANRSGIEDDQSRAMDLLRRFKRHQEHDVRQWDAARRAKYERELGLLYQREEGGLWYLRWEAVNCTGSTHVH